MNITQMHLAVQQGVDKINSFQADSLLPEEIDLELNKAITKFVNLKYGKNNQHGKGFEESQKRIDDLRTLISKEDLKSDYVQESVKNSFIYETTELPGNYRYLIKILCTVAYKSDCTSLSVKEQTKEVEIKDPKTELTSLKFVQQDDIHTLLADPFNTTEKTKPLFTIEDDRLKIYTNDIFIIGQVNLTYIKNPAIVSLSLNAGSDLPLHTHQEIVDMAISSILEGISDPRYRTQQLELGKNE